MQRQNSSQATSTLGNTPNLNIGSYTKGNPIGYFETIICGEMLGTPTQCYTFVLQDDTGQKTRLT